MDRKLGFVAVVALAGCAMNVEPAECEDLATRCPSLTMIGSSPSHLPLSVVWVDDVDAGAVRALDALNGSCAAVVEPAVDESADVAISVDDALGGDAPGIVVDVVNDQVLIAISRSLAEGSEDVLTDALIRMISRDAIGIDGVTRECAEGPRT